jgi:hypothetical protein
LFNKLVLNGCLEICVTMDVSKGHVDSIQWAVEECISPPIKSLLRIVIILLFPLPIQLINDFLSARQHFQCPTPIVMVSRLRHQKVRRDGARNHESAHDLQDFAEVLLLPVVLFFDCAGLESVREEDLHEPGAEFPGGRGDAVASAAVARGENFGRDLDCVSPVNERRVRVLTMKVVTLGPRLNAM